MASNHPAPPRIRKCLQVDTKEHQHREYRPNRLYRREQEQPIGCRHDVRTSQSRGGYWSGYRQSSTYVEYLELTVKFKTQPKHSLSLYGRFMIAFQIGRASCRERV